MRLDHLLSKERISKGWIAVDLSRTDKNSGGDALKGHTRPHPEHDG